MDAYESDPIRLGWMQGFPPPDDKLIRFETLGHFRFPEIRWAFSHMQELAPSVRVPRGLDAVYKFPTKLNSELDAIRFKSYDGQEFTWESSLQANYTDGIIVLHRGHLVYEKYFGEYTPDKMHVLMSVTKSFVGLLATLLKYQGVLQTQKLVVDYVPELAESAFASATVQQVMDMTTSLQYSELYTDPNADVWKFVQAGNLRPQSANYDGPQGFYNFLKTVKQAGPHGQAFAYKTVNTEVLSWVVQRAANQPLAKVLSDVIWKKIGAEMDAMIQVDKTGTPFGGGGMNCGLMDLARFGEMMRCEGSFNGQQIVPKEVVQDIAKGADQAHFEKAGYVTLPGFSYHNMWWVSHNAHQCYTARGIHGQLIWIDPKAEMVIVRFGSHKDAANTFNDPISIPSYEALGKYFVQNF